LSEYALKYYPNRLGSTITRREEQFMTKTITVSPEVKQKLSHWYDADLLDGVSVVQGSIPGDYSARSASTPSPSTAQCT
jgi:hypothetical protein